MASPPLRWVGGKRQLVPELLTHVNEAMRGAWDVDYYEPFAGAAALFFALRAENPGAVLTPHLNDANRHLINFYLALRDAPDDLLQACESLDRSLTKHGHEETYPAIRDAFNAAHASVALGAPSHAALFFAINRWGFNGLWRVNRKGECNVPPGRFYDARRRVAEMPRLAAYFDNLREVSKALQGVEITHGDFATATEDAEAGDLVYFDPPYLPASLTSNFVGYTGDGFGWEDQVRLRDHAKTLAARGVHVILSNADVPAARKLYQLEGLDTYFAVHRVEARRAVNCDATKRGKVGELIIVGITP